MNRSLNILAVFMSAGELITNGDFSRDRDDWDFSAWSDDNSSIGEAVVENGILEYTVGNGGPNTWNVQFFRRDIPLVQGSSYTFSFDAWAQSNDSISLFMDNQAGFGRIPLSTSPQTFTIDFTMDSATTATGRLSFDLGGNNRQGIFYFDNISLKISPHASAAPICRKGGLPASNRVSIKGNRVELQNSYQECYQVSLFNLQGRLVTQMHSGHLGAGNHLLRIPEQINSGSYLLKIEGNGGETVMPLVIRK